jgi:hypothetical protein
MPGGGQISLGPSWGPPGSPTYRVGFRRGELPGIPIATETPAEVLQKFSLGERYPIRKEFLLAWGVGWGVGR